MAEFEDEDEFLHDFDGLDFDNIPGLQAPTISRDTPEVFVPSSAIPGYVIPSTVASPMSSTGSNSSEYIDSTFLATVDALEARELSEMSQDGHITDAKSALPLDLVSELLNSGNTLKTAFDSWGEGTSNLNQVHEHSSELSTVNRKGKRKAEPREDIDVGAILAGYDMELTCPICCDLLVGAQVANPCGHTTCGECGYGWLAQNKYEPTCGVCRSSLCTRTPLLPNFAVDNFVRQHLQALARSGRPEWQEKGYRTIEWNKRVESWKKQTDGRAAKKKLKETTHPRRRQFRYYEAEDYPYAPPWLVDERIEDDEPLVARVMPRRAARSRR